VNSKYRSALSIGLVSVLAVALTLMLSGCGPLFRPTAKISTDPPVTNGTVSVGVGEDVEFDGSASEARGDATIDEYDWDFGDGNDDTGETVTHSYDETGTYTVTLEVTDSNGATGEATVTVEVTDLSASFTMDPNPVTLDPGGDSDEVTLDASASTGNIDSYDWTIENGGTINLGGGEELTFDPSDEGVQTGSNLVTLRVETADGDVAISGDTLVVEE